VWDKTILNIVAKYLLKANNSKIHRDFARHEFIIILVLILDFNKWKFVLTSQQFKQINKNFEYLLCIFTMKICLLPYNVPQTIKI